jgi:hypothetical protein
MTQMFAPKVKVAIHTHDESGQEVLKSRTIELDLQEVDYNDEWLAYYCGNDPENLKDFYEVWIPRIKEETSVTQ